MEKCPIFFCDGDTIAEVSFVDIEIVSDTYWYMPDQVVEWTMPSGMDHLTVDRIIVETPTGCLEWPIGPLPFIGKGATFRAVIDRRYGGEQWRQCGSRQDLAFTDTELEPVAPEEGSGLRKWIPVLFRRSAD